VVDRFVGGRLFTVAVVITATTIADFSNILRHFHLANLLSQTVQFFLKVRDFSLPLAVLQKQKSKFDIDSVATRRLTRQTPACEDQ
jgi:hypothetical protein